MCRPSWYSTRLRDISRRISEGAILEYVSASIEESELTQLLQGPPTSRKGHGDAPAGSSPWGLANVEAGFWGLRPLSFYLENGFRSRSVHDRNAQPYPGMTSNGSTHRLRRPRAIPASPDAGAGRRSRRQFLTKSPPRNYSEGPGLRPGSPGAEKRGRAGGGTRIATGRTTGPAGLFPKTWWPSFIEERADGPRPVYGVRCHSFICRRGSNEPSRPSGLRQMDMLVDVIDPVHRDEMMVGLVRGIVAREFDPCRSLPCGRRRPHARNRTI